MKCAHCRKTITGAEVKKAVFDRTPEGKIKKAYHKKCAHVIKRRAQLDADDRSSAPTAYQQAATKQNADDMTVAARQRRERAEAELARLKEMQEKAGELGDVVVTADGSEVSLDDLLLEKQNEVVLAVRQEEIAEQSELEERPTGWTDHRDPVETEL